MIEKIGHRRPPSKILVDFKARILAEARKQRRSLYSPVTGFWAQIETTTWGRVISCTVGKSQSP